MPEQLVLPVKPDRPSSRYGTKHSAPDVHGESQTELSITVRIVNQRADPEGVGVVHHHRELV